MPDEEAGLQLRGGIEDNSKIFFLFHDENIGCNPSLESSHRDCSDQNSLSETVLMRGHDIFL